MVILCHKRTKVTTAVIKHIPHMRLLVIAGGHGDGGVVASDIDFELSVAWVGVKFRYDIHIGPTCTVEAFSFATRRIGVRISPLPPQMIGCTGCIVPLHYKMVLREGRQ